MESKRKKSAEKARAFKRALAPYYEAKCRKLPWRKSINAYRVLVSEIMLQQTHVDRVVPKYLKFLSRFPTVQSLSKASLASVLRQWQGLGYNRRAKMLHEAARRIVDLHGGKVPHSYEELLALSGVGEYTAHAVRVFAFDEPDVLIETNVRTVYIHHFFKNKRSIKDSELSHRVKETLDTKRPRRFYSALMDYGTELKAEQGNISRRSAHYVRQKPFKGSEREVRGAILRALSTRHSIASLPFEAKRIAASFASLHAEGLVEKTGRTYRLAR